MSARIALALLLLSAAICLADDGVWFRRAVPLDEPARLAARSNQLGVLFGPASYGGYEAYAGGRLIGRSRGWSSSLPFGYSEVFRVPADAVERDGTVHLALRVRRIDWLAGSESDPVSGVITLGSYPALADRLDADWSRRLLNEVPEVILAALFAFAFFHQLALFGRRRRQTEHLWFGLLALAFAINTFASTYWIYELTSSRGIAVRLTDMTGHLAAAFAIQFLWTFFSRPIPPLLRAYQISHVALAAFVGLWPDMRPILLSSGARWLWLLPLLVLAAVRVLKETRLGDTEARVIAAGGVTMVVVEGAELARNVLHLQWPFDFSIAAFGFGAVIVAMSAALGLRFRRVHDELDRLRSRLEEEVRDRTSELADARDDALAASRVKSEFLANISHEIRTPMNGVIGMAEVLGRTSLTREQRAHLKAIEVSGRSLLALLNDVLDFSRLESKKLTIEKRPFRVRALVEESLEIMTPLADDKRLMLACSIWDGTVESIVGDQQRTRQVLLNLVSNAIKFTASGRVEVRVRSHPLDDGRVEVEFAVIDTGPGIAQEDLDRLFVAFQQLDGSYSRKHGGAGLGLAISKRLTELMGGTISVETTPGHGSTFRFTIVGDPGAAASSQLLSEAAGQTEAARRELRILLAEDEAINQVVVLDMLEQLGYRADSVTSGPDVLEALEKKPYDVILMDIQMPGLDGLEVTRRIRSGRGERPHIIALTAHALSGDRERCLAAGMNDYLSKPIRINDLQHALAGVS